MSKAKPINIPKRAVWEAWKKVRSNRGGAGIDEASLSDYESDLENNLYKLWNRLSSGSYFPPAVRVVEIPKSDGKKRRLGIPTVSDRIAQTIVKSYLEPRLELIFHKDSYGYRPNKSAIQAVGEVRERSWKFDWVLEFDIRGAFDNINHDLLLKAVAKHTSNKWIMLYIERWLKAPFQLLDGELESRDKGTPQGGVISPLLMNLFLHYVFDRWIVGRYPNNPFVRYADDGVVHCRSESEARELKESLEARFSECNLELNLDKTKIVYCKDSNRTQNYQSISFDFLGYTFRGRLAKSKVGKYFNSFSPAISRKATKKIGDEMRKWKIPRWTNATLEDLGSKANPKLRGWYQYFGNYYPSELNRHLRHFNRILSKWAQRKYRKLRSQRRAQAWLGQVAKRETQLFYHWGKGILPTG